MRLSGKWLRGEGEVFGGSDICYLRVDGRFLSIYFLSIKHDRMSGMVDASICLL